MLWVRLGGSSGGQATRTSKRPEVNVTRLPRGLQRRGQLHPTHRGESTSTGSIRATSADEPAFTPNTDRRLKILKNTLIDNVLGTLFGPGFSNRERRGTKPATHALLPDANPAHMIYESMTNADWGKGDPAEAFDEQSYLDAATTLQDEMFGLSMIWNGQDKIESFVGEVLDHIKGMQFQDPETGLWTLKLLRDDYVEDDCLDLDPSNCKVSNVKTRLWGETINKIIVTYTDPESEENTTVEDINLANVAIQGGTLSDTRDYHGVRNPWLAKIIARRDLAEASAILTSCTITMSRSSETFAPATWCISCGPGRTSTDTSVSTRWTRAAPRTRLTLKVVQDVFSVTAPTRAVAPVAVPSNPDEEAPAELSDVSFFPAPYFPADRRSARRARGIRGRVHHLCP